ncbi:hypothetical protein [Rhodohalobacter mucosus]|uniref:Fibronectin type-III domain-containing protein n=1 Tax=Rhodohalobacter mucosus TaxID=2079485 RepID=A0A316TW79_9BACT|nr:hypothetical protein [Rhodohalobacter mucosus]PWN07629.1 hypothetical protein DDZ15_05070 [Rhodohalobacter mucosus]
MNFLTKHSNALIRFAGIAVIVLLSLFNTNGAVAQSSTQVTIIGVPPVLSTPFTDDIRNNFENGQYQVILNYSGFSTVPVDFVFDFALSRNGRELIRITSAPIAFTPGSYVFSSFFEEIQFRETADEILSGLDSELTNQLIQTGAIPEGNYTVEITARPFTQQSGIVTVPGRAMFSVRYPTPPILVSVPDGANVTMDTPTFSWTPVVSSIGGTFEYDILLVEVFPEQTPFQALNSNRAHMQETLTGQTVLPYTLEFLPLEEGATYAWRVTARDAFGRIPLQNEGESDIYTFTYRDETSEPIITDLEELESITLVPGFAELVELEGLDVTETGSYYELNGDAVLNLNFNYTDAVRGRISVRNLRIQKGSLDNPIVMGGALSGRGDFISQTLDQNEIEVEVDLVEWVFGENFNVSVSVRTPDGRQFEASQQLALTASGIQGTLNITNEDLFTFSDEYAEFGVNELTISFPEFSISGRGYAKLFGNEEICSVNGFSVENGEIRALLFCEDYGSISLGGNEDIAQLNFDQFSGEIVAGLSGNTLGYDLEITLSAGLKNTTGSYCGVESILGLNENEGLSTISSRYDCSVPEPTISLGFIELEMVEAQMNEISFNPETNEWNFELQTDLKIHVPVFDSWTSAIIEDIRIDNRGVHFETIQLGTGNIPLPQYVDRDLNIALSRFEINQSVFPLFDWDESGPGPWDVEFEGVIEVASDSDYPACLIGKTIEFQGGQVSDMEVFARIVAENLENCRADLGESLSVSINRVSGRIGAQFYPDGSYETLTEVNIDGNLQLSEPFICDTNESGLVDVSSLNIAGGLNGVVENVVPDCEVQIGPLSAIVTDSRIEFSKDDLNPQEAVLLADAEINFLNGSSFEGTFALDLISGEFLSVSFDMDEPFDWYIPTEDEPVMVFRISSASLDENGLNIDGRNELLLENDTTIGTTFDNLQIDLETLQITSGRIIFDESFALAGGIDPVENTVNFKAVEVGSEFTDDPGIYVELGGTIIIDSSGMTVSGDGNAIVNYAGESYGDLTVVEFSDDFSLSLFPFKVGSGRANLLYQGSVFAYLDPDGFHPAPGFFADLLIPDVLPLPSESIAYLELRRDDQLLVNVTENEDGNYVLASIPNEPLSIYVPALNPADPPVLSDITLQNVVISADPTNPQVLEGTIYADVPTDNSLFDLNDRNVPLTVEQVFFGTRMVDGNPLTAFYLLGNLHLFDETVNSSDQTAEFYFQNDGYLRANLSLAQLNQRISLLPDNTVQLRIDQVTGTFQIPEAFSTPVYDFNIAGGLEINSDGISDNGADLSLRITENTFDVTGFSGLDFNEDVGIDFGVFGIDLYSIVSLPVFNYSDENGFEFAISLDLDLTVNPVSGEPFNFPLLGTEIRNDGIHIPPQNINESSIPGLNLPEFNLAGFAFKPIVLQSSETFVFNWDSPDGFNPNISMDFQLKLPEFEGTGFNPPDGFTFRDVSISNDGFLSGSITPFEPLGGVEIDLSPDAPESPTIWVNRIEGVLEKSDDQANPEHLVSITVDGELGDLPGFTVDDPQSCVTNPEFSLNLVESRYFEGSVANIQPCGYLGLGPVKVRASSTNLNLFVSENSQRAEVSGTVIAELPADDGQTDVSVTGSMTLDLMTGKIGDGSLTVNQPFGLNFPYSVSEPLLDFTVNQAVLDSTGLMLQGSGTVGTDEGLSADIQFNDLLFGFEPFSVKSGSANVNTALSFNVGLSPFSLSIRDIDTTPLSDNSIRIDLLSGFEINQAGLSLTGSSTSAIRFGGQDYGPLQVEYSDGFTVSAEGFGVVAGRAEFFDDSGPEPAAEPLAILDQSGFSLGADVLTFLPDRLLLPSENVAYVDIKDDQGNLLVDLSQNESGGGYVVQTNGTPLELVLASVRDSNNDPVAVDIEFDVTTDDAYNITGGSITLQSNVDLESMVNLPLSITSLEYANRGSGMRLYADIKADLPAVLNNADVTASVVISETGLESGIVEVGTYSTSYNPSIIPLYTFSHSGTIDQSMETDIFEASLLGLQLEIGSTSMGISGTLSSSLVIDESAGDMPLFFTSSYTAGEWTFNIDPGSLADELNFGQASLTPDQHNGFGIYSDATQFYFSINGIVSFERILGEPLDISITDLEIGINDLNSNPSLHFDLGGVAGSLQDQTFSLFDGAFSGVINQPTIVLSGRTLGISSSTGTVTFLQTDIDYENLLLDTDGGFQFGSFNTGSIDLIENYISLESLSLVNNNGLQLDADLSVTLPAPVSSSAMSTISIYRDSADQVVVDIGEPQFDLNQQFALGEFGYFQLKKIGADIDPYDWSQSGIYANAVVVQNGKTDPILYFGEDSSFPGNPGIGIYPGQQQPVEFNVTGNVGFSFDVNVLTVAVNFDQVTASESGFEVTFNGTASLNLSGLSGSLGYQGFTVNQEGVSDVGNLSGTGSIDILGIASLSLGQFHYISNPQGEQITLKDTSKKGPDEIDTNSDEVPGKQISVVELLCFGPCPVGVEGSSDNAALELSIGADANSDSGFKAGVQSVFMYETTDGEKLLSIEGFIVNIDEFFTMTASLNYMKDENQNFLLRAAATATFNLGGTTASAMVAGKFASIGGESSYGLFVAVSSSVGIPIVPGVIDLTGAGGGFFYRPDTEDLQMVETALAGFGYNLVSPDALPERDDIQFAVMLYASMGIAGGASNYMIEGSTFLRITNKNFYMDARGTVLQMDGEGIARARVDASFYFGMQRDPFFMMGGVAVNMNIPGAVSGSGTIEFFLKEETPENLWGIIGDIDFSVMGGILEGDGEFLAANMGFLVEVSVGFEVGIPVISVKSQVTGSVWLITDPNFSMPFGAYVVFEASACAFICIEVEAKAAFVVYQPIGFELYAAIKGCVDLWIDKACLSAWASIRDDGISGGIGPGSHNDLISKAKAQRDQFRAKIEEMRNQIQAAKDALNQPPPFQGFDYSDEDVRKAGANIYASTLQERNIIYGRIQDNVERTQFNTIPTQFDNLINNVLLAPRSHQNLNSHELLSPDIAKVNLEQAITVASNLSDQVNPRLATGLETSIEFLNEAENQFDDLMNAMSESPVSNVYRPVPSTNVQAAPSFQVDGTLAANQSQVTEDLKEEIDKLDQQFRESIAAVEQNLAEMHGLLATDFEPAQSDGEKATVIPGVNVLAEQYAHVLNLMEKYYANEANMRWLEWNWARNLRTTVINNSSLIQSGIQTLNSNFNSALYNRNSDYSSYSNQVYSVVQRYHALLRYKDGNMLLRIPPPSQGPQDVRESYTRLLNPNCENTNSLTCITDEAARLNNSFWYDMHEWGLEEYASTASRTVVNEVVPAHNQLKQSLTEAHKNFTQILDQFYTNKASLTAILYNILDNYVSWNQSVNPDGTSEPSDIDAYQLRLAELSDELVPPQITGVTVDPSRPVHSYERFYNTTAIDWNATHPVGIVENSIDVKQFEDDTDISVGINDYLSVGENNSITIYPYKRAHPRSANPSQAEIEFYNTRTINFGVRVRGYAGNTAIRRAIFDVDVGPGGNTTGKGTDVLPVTQLRPDKPTLYLSSFYEKTTSSMLVPISDGSPFGFELQDVDRYWTSDPSSIRMQVLAHDSETGISTYEYAVGSTKGATDIVEWTELQGERNFYAYMPSSEMVGNTRFLNMVEGAPYYVSVRVINGAGAVSDPFESPAAVIYDSTPPTDPGITFVAAPFIMPMYLYGYTTPVDPVLETVPPLNISSDEKESWTDSATPKVNAYWSESTDSESGLMRYEYIITDSVAASIEEFTPYAARETMDLQAEYFGPMLPDYDTEVFIHVRALNNAGMSSEIYSIGPLKARDTTGPNVGRMQAMIGYDRIGMYLTKLPYDPETDLLGIQYAVGTSPGATDIRSWPLNDSVDFEWNLFKSNALYSPILGYKNTPDRHFEIPFNKLPVGPTFYISYRSVNGQGMKSGVRSTGPINLDETPPLAPTLSVRYNGTDDELNINVSGIDDPQSGIEKVEYSIQYPYYWMTLQSWTDMHTHTGIKHGSFSLSRDVSFSNGEIETPTNITVKVRLTNGAGLQRTISKQVSFSDIYYVFKYNNPQYSFPKF